MSYDCKDMEMELEGKQESSSKEEIEDLTKFETVRKRKRAKSVAHIYHESTRSFLEKYCIGSSSPMKLDDHVAYVRDIYNSAATSVRSKDKRNATNLSLRVANNFIKSILLARFVPKDKVVIELGCGKGPDMYKLQYVKPSYVIFVDIAERCLMEAEKRWRINKYQFPATFVRGDFCSSDLLKDRDIIIYRSNDDRKVGEQEDGHSFLLRDIHPRC